MKERPILFSGAMVRAILEGRKTQTRRVVKGLEVRHSMPEPELASLLRCCPYGVPSDRLWVRETFTLEHCVEPDQSPPHSDGRPIKRRPDDDIEGYTPLWLQPHYKATDPEPELDYEDGGPGMNDGPRCRWKPSIHMPRWASRITMEVKGVRVERLQDISDADALDEGVEWSAAGDGWRRYADAASELAGLPPCATARDSYRSLWEQINGAGSWEANPYVWCIDFRVTP